MGKLLHVLGGGPWQLPTIRRARALGHRVLVSDGRVGAPGFAEADLHALADLTDFEATLDAAGRHSIDGILCDTTDTGVLTAARVADVLGLPGVGVEAARACTDKARMGELAAGAGLKPPRCLRLRVGEPLPAAAELISLAAQDTEGRPGHWVVKPSDNQSGRGVRIVADAADLPSALLHAGAHSRAGEVLVQEAIAGPEFIVDSLVVAGRVHRLGLARKVPYADNPTIAQRISYGSAAELDVAQVNFDAVNQRLIAALGIRQGLVHAEYLLDGDVPRPIDVAARGGGVMIYPLVLSHLAAMPVMDIAIALALGQAPAGAQGADAVRAANVEFLRVPPGLIGALHGVEAARAMAGVAALHLNRGVGDRSPPLADKDNRLGFVVTLGEELAPTLQAGLQAAARIRVEVRADDHPVAEEGP